MGEQLPFRESLKTKEKSAARIIERIEKGMEFMGDSLLCARGVRQWNEIQDGHADFMFKRQCLGKP
jgi:hypothetical protein